MEKLVRFLVLVVALTAFVFSALAYRSAGASKLSADVAGMTAIDALAMAKKAEDRARVGTWHLMVAQTGPHAGMPVTLRDAAGLEQPALLLRKSANGGWLLAAFDETTRAWTITGPHVEGTREELGTWTPAICGGMRAGFTGFDHEGHDHESGRAASRLGDR